jgi:hypothetical protein
MYLKNRDVLLITVWSLCMTTGMTTCTVAAGMTADLTTIMVAVKKPMSHGKFISRLKE